MGPRGVPEHPSIACWPKQKLPDTLDGKRTERIAPQDNRATLSLNHLPAGVYFGEARNATGSRIVQQIVKRDL